MSAPSRRKKATSAKAKRTFRLVIEAQEMVIDYKSYWMSDYGQFEFRSPHKAARRIPVSETGYRSHFAPMAEVEASASPEDYAREVALALIRSGRKPAAELPGQLSLF